MKRRNSGFTLLEVLVCIIILGIVAGAGLMLFMRSSSIKLKTATSKNIANQISEVYNYFETDDSFYTNFMNGSAGRIIYFNQTFAQIEEAEGDNYFDITYSENMGYMKVVIKVYRDGALFKYSSQDEFSLERRIPS